MKTINTSIYTFENIIKEDCLYVDKTEYFYKLVTKKRGQFFMSRPRRFGKSLAISTLDAIFRGKRELFKGLKIYDMDYDWEEYPVVHIDFARTVMTDKGTFERSLGFDLDKIAEEYGVSCSDSSPGVKFKMLMNALKEKTGKDVVLLIDEYDKPLLDHMGSPEEAESWRKYMDSFYQVIKGSEKDIRFVFMTGVTKFAKVSIFSKLNNITDITMHRDYSEMFGYTQDELLKYFDEYLEDAVKTGIKDRSGNPFSKEGLIDEIKRWYDGFKFSKYGKNVYNPVSIGQFMDNSYEFKNYWFSTGTPTFLMELLKKNSITVEDVAKATIVSDSFEVFNVSELSGDRVNTDTIIEMLYQTGYLTLDGEVPGFLSEIYQLRFPNYEVETSFKENLVDAYMGQNPLSLGQKLYMSASEGDTNEMMDLLSSYFAGFPYDIQIKAEKYYQSMVKVIFEMCGMDVSTEEKTNTGRIDAVLDAGDHLYIIEFKLNKTSDEALSQIDDKKYAQKYILPAREKGLTVHKLGINFSYAEGERNITEWKEEL